MRIRDNQRAKMYRSENGIKKLFPPVSKVELDEFIKLVMEIEVPAMKYTIAHTRRGGAWCKYTNTQKVVNEYAVNSVELNFSPSAMTLFIAIHEICHAICPSPEGYEPHGPEFAKKQLELTKEYLGEEYAKILEEGYVNYNVKYGDMKYSTGMKRAANTPWITEKKYFYSVPITESQHYIIEDAMQFYFTEQQKIAVTVKKTRIQFPKAMWYEELVGIIGAIESGATWCSGSDRQRDGMQEWCWKVRGELCKKYPSKEDKLSA